ncbi:MAG: hypothetical protein LC808_32385 [Actinobacteria bacterium]|nr:hypothetical protein [Actinomycetota bacterium]
MRRRKRIGDIETGVESLPRDEPGGCLLIGQVVSGVKVARAWSGLLWNSGTCRPDRVVGQWSGCGPRSVIQSENSKQRELRGGE